MKGATATGKITSACKLGNSHQLQTLAITETHLTENHLQEGKYNAEIHKNWALHARPAPEKQGTRAGRGGIALLTHKDIQVKLLQEEISEQDGQAATWHLSSDKWETAIQITVVYISPHISEATLRHIKHHIASNNTPPLTIPSYTVGDFNAHTGDKKYETNMTDSEKKKWGSKLGDKNKNPSQQPNSGTAAGRGRWLLQILQELDMLIANGRFQNITQPNHPPFTHIHHNPAGNVSHNY